MSDINNSSLRIDKSRIFWINFWIYHSCNSCVFLDCIFSLVLYFKLKKRIEVLTYAKYPISYGPYVSFTRIELQRSQNSENDAGGNKNARHFCPQSIKYLAQRIWKWQQNRFIVLLPVVVELNSSSTTSGGRMVQHVK